MPENRTLILVLVSLLPWLFAAGCNEVFEPWQENDQYFFSIYGYLDASADTQWVRVMPVREDLFLEPKPIDATVTLEHINSGEATVMNDSLFSYDHDRYAYNFWTTIELQPEHTYRITAQRSDGHSSHAEVTLPEDFPTPMVRRDPPQPGGIPPKDLVFIEGVERLADIRTIHYIRFLNSGEKYMVPFVHLQDSIRQASGDFIIVIDSREEQNVLESLVGRTPTLIFHRQIFIASAGPDYHNFGSIDDKVIALPKGISNIENGVGYLAGVISKTIPYKSCFEEGTITLVPCPLEPYPWSGNMPVWDQ